MSEENKNKPQPESKDWKGNFEKAQRGEVNENKLPDFKLTPPPPEKPKSDSGQNNNKEK